MEMPRVRPSFGLLAAAVAVLAVVVGLGGYTFQRAEGHSYLSDDPAACVNCHVMRDQYQDWGHSSHREYAVCNDCHTPTGFVNKWFTKALNGWHHSVAFTTMDFDEPIRITERNRRIAQERCIDCHGDITGEMGAGHWGPEEIEEIDCVFCHGNVGHRGPR